jgi:hypothetical protein
LSPGWRRGVPEAAQASQLEDNDDNIPPKAVEKI